jgi:hypothetical protein
MIKYFSLLVVTSIFFLCSCGAEKASVSGDYTKEEAKETVVVETPSEDEVKLTEEELAVISALNGAMEGEVHESWFEEAKKRGDVNMLIKLNEAKKFSAQDEIRKKEQELLQSYKTLTPAEYVERCKPWVIWFEREIKAGTFRYSSIGLYDYYGIDETWELDKYGSHANYLDYPYWAVLMFEAQIKMGVEPYTDLGGAVTTAKKTHTWDAQQRDWLPNSRR